MPSPGRRRASESFIPAVPVECTQLHRMIAAATRLRDAWALTNLDVGQMHEAALGLIFANGTKDLQTVWTFCTTSRPGTVNIRRAVRAYCHDVPCP